MRQQASGLRPQASGIPRTAGAAILHHVAQDLDLIGDDPVNTHVKQPVHLLGLVDSPHVDLLAGTVGCVDSALIDHGDPHLHRDLQRIRCDPARPPGPGCGEMPECLDGPRRRGNPTLRQLPERSPTTNSARLLIRGFGTMLSSVTLSAHGYLTSELLRTLSRDGCF